VVRSQTGPFPLQKENVGPAMPQSWFQAVNEQNASWVGAHIAQTWKLWFWMLGVGIKTGITKSKKMF
jgi:hypothetical protein